MSPNVKQIIAKAQMRESNSEKFTRMLLELYKESEPNKFFADFIDVLLGFLSQDFKAKNSYIQRGLKFCAKVSVLINDDTETKGDFLASVFTEVLQYYNSSSCIWRYRVCEFMGMLFAQLSDDYSLDENIWERVIEVMTIRLNDMSSSVRLQAATALERLQNPNDVNDIVTKIYTEHIYDDNIHVRKKITQCLATSVLALPMFIEKCLDVDVSVREIAFNKLGKYPIRIFKIEQRQYILRNIFKNADKKINPTTLITDWFKPYDGDYFNFLLTLKLDEDEDQMMNTLKIYEQVTDVFFRNEPLKNLISALELNENKLIPCENVTWEKLVFWRCLMKHIYENVNDAEYLDQITPVLTHTCEFTLRIYESRSKYQTSWEIIQHDFIMLELFKIVDELDFSEEVGRKALVKLLTDILTSANISEMNIIAIQKFFENLIPDVEERIEQFCTIISEIRKPLVAQPLSQDYKRKRDIKIAELKVKLNIEQDKKETAVEKQDFEAAREAQTAINGIRSTIKDIEQQFKDLELVRVTRNDMNTVAYSLDMLNSVLSSDDLTALPERMNQLLDDFVIPLLVNKNSKITTKAMKCLALCCFVDQKRAEICSYIFSLPLIAYRYLQNYEFSTLVTVMQICTDLIMMYNKQFLFNEEDATINTTNKKDGTRRLFGDLSNEDSQYAFPTTFTFEEFIEIMLSLLNDDNDEVRNTTGTCLVKLLKNGLLHCPNVITQLIIKWFNPCSKKDNYLSQLIGDALTYYAEKVHGSLEIIIDAFVPTISVIIDAPEKSPLLDINLDSLIKFMIALCYTGRDAHNEGLDSHKSITFLLCQEICSKPNTKASFVYLKTLMLLDIPFEDEQAVKDLQKQLDILFELIKDKKSRTWLTKYKQKLASGLNANNNSIFSNGTSANTSKTGIGADNSRRSENSSAAPTSMNTPARGSAVSLATTNSNTETDTDSSLSGTTASTRKRKTRTTRLQTIAEQTDVENTSKSKDDNISKPEESTSESDSESIRPSREPVRTRRWIKKRKNEGT